MNRRGFLTATVCAPAVILTPGLLMPVRKMWVPDLSEEALEQIIGEIATKRDARVSFVPNFAQILRPELGRIYRDAYRTIGEAVNASARGDSIIVLP